MRGPINVFGRLVQAVKIFFLRLAGKTEEIDGGEPDAH